MVVNYQIASFFVETVEKLEGFQHVHLENEIASLSWSDRAPVRGLPYALLLEVLLCLLPNLP